MTCLNSQELDEDSNGQTHGRCEATCGNQCQPGQRPSGNDGTKLSALTSIFSPVPKIWMA
eukprot:2370472-Karenia_brevis.AAC.1